MIRRKTIFSSLTFVCGLMLSSLFVSCDSLGGQKDENKVDYLAVQIDENDSWSIIDAEGKDTYVKVDVMGKVQLQGTLSRIHKLVDYLEKMDDNEENEQEFKSYMTQVNGLMNLGVFYDNTSTRQARVVLEAFEDDYGYYDDEKYWYAEPVIHFYDGTSYSTMSAFFDEDDFKRLVDTFEDLVDAYDAIPLPLHSASFPPLHMRGIRCRVSLWTACRLRPRAAPCRCARTVRAMSCWT